MTGRVTGHYRLWLQDGGAQSLAFLDNGRKWRHVFGLYICQVVESDDNNKKAPQQQHLIMKLIESKM